MVRALLDDGLVIAGLTTFNCTLDSHATTLPAGAGLSTWVASYAPQVGLRWAVPITGSDVFSRSVTAVGDGIAVVGGLRDLATFDSTTTLDRTAPGDSDAFIARYDASGNLLWAKSTAVGASWATAEAVAAFPDGSLAAAGAFHDSAAFGAGEVTRPCFPEIRAITSWRATRATVQIGRASCRERV